MVKMVKKGLEDAMVGGQGEECFKEEAVRDVPRVLRKATGLYKNMSVCGELYK